MKQSMRKPEHWQDFETLCKKLWSEIWKCDARKNGRSGQNQSGIDVSGVPEGETNYHGIQCKGKDDYTVSKLTEKEIDTEIKKALTFKPALKKMIFATTANKDVAIEEYIREKNIESITNGKFEIDIYSWEDIADLIEENIDTYNFYVNKINHKSRSQVEVFVNGEQKPIISPIFCLNKTLLDSTFVNKSKRDEIGIGIAKHISFNNEKKNNSFSELAFEIKNTGSVAFEEIKLELEVIGEYQYISETNIENQSIISQTIFDGKPFTITKNKIIYRPKNDNKILIPKDSKRFKIFLKPEHKKYDLQIKWRFLSKDFNRDGELTIKVLPTIKEYKNTRLPQAGEIDGTEIEKISDSKELMENK